VKLLGLDISTKAGWAVLDSVENGLAALKATGLVEKTRKNVLEYGAYPECYRRAAHDISDQMLALIRDHCPDMW
jgi:predicted transcriptional regulator